MSTPKQLLLIAILALVLDGCGGAAESKTPPELVASADQMNVKAAENIRELIKRLDSSWIHEPDITSFIYNEKNFGPLWSTSERWLPAADSFYQAIAQARLMGLFPENYHYEQLSGIRQRVLADSAGRADRIDPAVWARADLYLTDAFLHFVHDVKLGRLPNDSISLNSDSVITKEEYLRAIEMASYPDSLSALIRSLEPTERGYWQLKNAIPSFLDSASFRNYTQVPSPKDSFAFRRALQKRLFEEGFLSQDSIQVDSAELADGVKKFQRDRGITIDGKVGEGTLRMLNVSDEDKFIRIAISLDKYKKLPRQMPEKYIWVNASGNYMEVIEEGKVKLSSRVITGKPKTKTPLLNGSISMLITYPQWVPPPSIIQKEILPAVKKNPAYLSKKGFSLVDGDGEEVDPFSVDWSKYNKSIPYKVVQGSGDANALGIIKFHFDNKYSVYLHDTNQRYLFANAMRSLSHGCVRVQQWRELLQYIMRNDSLHWTGTYTRMDSVQAWLKNKERRQLALKARMPVFIRYMTCQGVDGKVIFFDDVYGDDKFLRENYFASKRGKTGRF